MCTQGAIVKHDVVVINSVYKFINIVFYTIVSAHAMAGRWAYAQDGANFTCQLNLDWVS